MGVRRLAVANGPNIFQMLLVLLFNKARRLRRFWNVRGASGFDHITESLVRRFDHHVVEEELEDAQVPPLLTERIDADVHSAAEECMVGAPESVFCISTVG